ALKDLRGFGIIPDIVCVRSEKPCNRKICEKIAAFSGIPGEAVLNLPDIKSVYDVPFNVLKSGVLEILNDFVGDDKKPDMQKWEEFSKLRSENHPQTVKVGLVAKYVGNEDTYICVTEALKAAAAHNKVNLEISWINAEEATEKDFKSVDGLVVPGGFGLRGVEGKIKAATYALETDKPYLGLCLGLQAACIAAARKAGLKGAGSEEFLNDEDYKKPRDFKNVIYIMDGQQGKESTGGTMRLGDYPAILKKGSKVADIYQAAYQDGHYQNGTELQKNGNVKVIERHRHRYEVNQAYLKDIEKGGLIVSGTSPDKSLVEFVEAPDKTFFVATQAHPEFKSRPLNVHPLFYDFIKVLKNH
ncbi:CTP synthase, partial [Candidatus Saccharibacteria bacterium]|nr:CTP synthase [Candidatus Saccharibacteria bacterium]